MSTATSEKESVNTCSQMFSFSLDTFPDKHTRTLFSDSICTWFGANLEGMRDGRQEDKDDDSDNE